MKTILILALVALAVSSKVAISLEGSSFHRSLRIELYDLAKPVELNFSLPTGVFLDPHDPRLPDMNATGATVAVTCDPSDINIELPECAAEPMTVALHISPTQRATTALPLHVRYWCAEVPGSGIHNYTIPPPTCDGSDELVVGDLQYAVPYHLDDGWTTSVTLAVICFVALFLLVEMVCVRGF
ncbi:hypothetical protein J8273_4018 [Carpediemonas membranifera]|uniref:Uncharacterized protein n=1 Tax=Carpediemonas membranifera TaxID=201153 RepID=A0A8J6E004_9EUKA|nr:hypothetical protein J8273_4018 [Carpediemonas membranifera]|eukprot:KAG9394374.1 hypothetical protein J8273_4018 [Carpediemonas membranifera]